MFAQSQVREKAGQHEEKTSFKQFYGTDAVKLAKSDAGKLFNSSPKVIEVKVWDADNKQVLHLEKNPMTLECITRMSA